MVTMEHLAAMALPTEGWRISSVFTRALKEWHALDIRKFKAILRRHGLEQAYQDWLEVGKKTLKSSQVFATIK